MHTDNAPDHLELGSRYIIAISRHKLLVISITAVTVFMAAFLAYQLTPIYRATVEMEVRYDATEIIGMQDIAPSDHSSDFYRTQCMLILGNEVLTEALVRLQPAMRTKAAGMSSLEIMTQMEAMINAKVLSGASIIRVYAEGANPKELPRIVTAVVDSYKTIRSKKRRQSTDIADRYFKSNIPELAAELEAAEIALANYQKENKIFSPEGVRSIVLQRLDGLSKDLSEAERARIELEAQLAATESAHDNIEALASMELVKNSVELRRIEDELFALSKERTELLPIVKVDHRDIRLLDAKIKDYRNQRVIAIRDVVATLSIKLDAARLREDVIKKNIALIEDEAAMLSSRLTRLRSLQGKVDYAKSIYEPQLERWKKATLASDLNAQVFVVSRAVTPKIPVRPNKVLLIFLGTIFGLFFGATIALFVEQGFAKVGSAQEVEHLTGVRTIGIIPNFTVEPQKDAYAVCRTHPRDVAAEAYRSMRTNILLSLDTNKPSVILITSTVGSDGKTMSSLNAAAAFAQTGIKVLLIDGDMRRSKVHEHLEIKRGAGLSECLVGEAKFEDVLRKTETEKLKVITAGTVPDNPAELLGSNRMTELLKWAKSNFDFVVIDSPPLAAVTDSQIMASMVDGVIAIARPGHTPRRALMHIRELIDNQHAKVLGVALNNIGRGGGRYGSGGYGPYSYYGKYASEPYAADSKKT